MATYKRNLRTYDVSQATITYSNQYYASHLNTQQNTRMRTEQVHKITHLACT